MCRVSFLLLFFWNIVLFAFSQEVNIQIKKALEYSRPVKLSEIASEQSFITLDYVSDLENDEDVFTYLLEDRIICNIFASKLHKPWKETTYISTHIRQSQLTA